MNEKLGSASGNTVPDGARMVPQGARATSGSIKRICGAQLRSSGHHHTCVCPWSPSLRWPSIRGPRRERSTTRRPIAPL
jgi:hypothetical protein